LGHFLLLDLMGGVALLLWGLHMVHSGIVRAFGANLRLFIRNRLQHRVSAFLAGLGVTTVLQSSTATALLAASLGASSALPLTTGLALMLGANVGTAVAVQILSLNVSAAAPVLFIVGLLAFKRGHQKRTRDLGRAAIGLGLMLLALHILLDTLAPAEEAPGMRDLIGLAAGTPWGALILAAVVTVAAHSSVATVLLVSSLAYSRFIGLEPALAMVLGANLGSALVPMLEAGRAVEGRRLALGNLLNRAAGCLVALLVLPDLAAIMQRITPVPTLQVAGFHLVFNLALALLFLPLLPYLAALLKKMLPAPQLPPDPGSPLYLDDNLISTPSVALASAERETLRLADLVEVMLTRSIDALRSNDRTIISEVARTEDTVDKLYEHIKLYLARLTRESLDEGEGRRAMEIVSFAINLEHVGDIIEKNLMELAAKRIKHGLRFSINGEADIVAFHGRVLKSLKLALAVFTSGDPKAADLLLREKAALRTEELAAAEAHFARLREGLPESLATSALHLDVMRDLKRIHSHLCSVAYSIQNGGRQSHEAPDGKPATPKPSSGKRKRPV
jgi:phosphate:Na+ symporter